MKLTNEMIVEALEQTAASFPWDRVEIWIQREPEGLCSFTLHVANNPKTGAPDIYVTEERLDVALKRVQAQAAARDPETSRNRAIRDLEERLVRLKAVVFGLPPYRPGTYLTNGEKDRVPASEATITV